MSDEKKFNGKHFDPGSPKVARPAVEKKFDNKSYEINPKEFEPVIIDEPETLKYGKNKDDRKKARKALEDLVEDTIKRKEAAAGEASMDIESGDSEREFIPDESLSEIREKVISDEKPDYIPVIPKPLYQKAETLSPADMEARLKANAILNLSVKEYKENNLKQAVKMALKTAFFPIFGFRIKKKDDVKGSIVNKDRTAAMRKELELLALTAKQQKMLKQKRDEEIKKEIEAERKQKKVREIAVDYAEGGIEIDTDKVSDTTKIIKAEDKDIKDENYDFII
ncbi:MAG: hypothetical protein ACOX3U_07075 [Christensenellales bacterium]|jgi:hypothetical protein